MVIYKMENGYFKIGDDDGKELKYKKTYNTITFETKSRAEGLIKSIARVQLPEDFIFA
jgi:hypothetical protein